METLTSDDISLAIWEMHFAAAINAPAEAMTRLELEEKWAVSDKTVLKRLRVLERAGKLGICQKPGRKINGKPYMADAYYYLSDE